MAEWLMRGTVNTFFRGSIPLDTYKFNYIDKIRIVRYNIKSYIIKRVKFIDGFYSGPAKSFN